VTGTDDDGFGEQVTIEVRKADLTEHKKAAGTMASGWVYYCEDCGSEDVHRRSWCSWNVKTQTWNFEEDAECCDPWWCNACDDDKNDCGSRYATRQEMAT
jgi:hypothetical protein